MHSLLLAALITVIPAQQRFGKRITIALDVSGSLYAKRAEALEAALEVLASVAWSPRIAAGRLS